MALREGARPNLLRTYVTRCCLPRRLDDSSRGRGASVKSFGCRTGRRHLSNSFTARRHSRWRRSNSPSGMGRRGVPRRQQLALCRVRRADISSCRARHVRSRRPRRRLLVRGPSSARRSRGARSRSSRADRRGVLHRLVICYLDRRRAGVLPTLDWALIGLFDGRDIVQQWKRRRVPLLLIAADLTILWMRERARKSPLFGYLCGQFVRTCQTRREIP